VTWSDQTCGATRAQTSGTQWTLGIGGDLELLVSLHRPNSKSELEHGLSERRSFVLVVFQLVSDTSDLLTLG
jgi:hypothetical protein